jgi:phospholipid-binding lipoprotein MlaA
MKAQLVTVAFAVLASACASQNVEMRTLPAQTPEADRQAAIAKLAAVASAPAPADTATVAPVTPSEVPAFQVYDPWERMNRFTYRFNARFDEHVFLPVANGYRRMPSPIRSGLHNFFTNLSEIGNVVNFALQGRIKYSVRSLGRFVFNTTAGIGGLFDFAADAGVKYLPTGVDDTLAKWGVNPGPYVVLPLLGPSSLRGAVGAGGDYGMAYEADIGGLYHKSDYAIELGIVQAIDQRANISFGYYDTGSAFEYEMVRLLYMHKRQIEDDGLRHGAANANPGLLNPSGR